MDSASDSPSSFRSSCGSNTNNRASVIEMERMHIDDTKRTRLLKEVIKSQDRLGSFSGCSRRTSRLGAFAHTGRESVDSFGSFGADSAHDFFGGHFHHHPIGKRQSSAEIADAHFKEVANQMGLGATQASASLDSFCLRAAKADKDLIVQLARSAERMRQLCRKVEEMECTVPRMPKCPLRHPPPTTETTATTSSSTAADTIAASADDSPVRIVARPEGSSAREERAKIEATALKYVSNTCEWKELDDLQSTVQKADQDELRRTFQPKRTGQTSPRIHPYLFLLTDAALLDDNVFRQCMWGSSPCQEAMTYMREAQATFERPHAHGLRRNRSCGGALVGGGSRSISGRDGYWSSMEASSGLSRTRSRAPPPQHEA